MKKKSLKVSAMGLLLLLLLAGCEFFTVNEGQRGVVTKSGKFSHVQEPGREWLGYLVDGKTINVSTVSVDFTDSSMLAGGEKPVSVQLSVNVRRTTDPERLQTAYSTYNSVMLSDDALSREVSERTAEAAKTAITKIPFWDIIESPLGSTTPQAVPCADEGVKGRDAFKQCIRLYLTQPLHEIGVDLIDVQIVEVTPSEALQAIVDELSTVGEEKRLSSDRLDLIDSQILEAGKLAELAEVQGRIYAASPELLEIELAKLRIEEAGVWAASNGNVTVIITDNAVTPLLDVSSK